MESEMNEVKDSEVEDKESNQKFVKDEKLKKIREIKQENKLSKKEER